MRLTFGVWAFALFALVTLMAAAGHCSDPMLGNNYGFNGTVGYFDNSPNFTKYNLWYPMPAGAPQIAQFATSRTSTNTFLWRGLDPSHNVWSYTESWNPYNGVWAQQTAMGTDNRVLALGHNAIYKLTNSVCTTANEYTVKKWNGSAWVDPSGAQSCSDKIAAGDIDGTLGSRVLSGHVYLIDAGTSTWVQLTGGPNNFQSVALSSKSYVLVNDTTGKIWQRTAGTNVVAASSFPNTPEVNGTLYTSYAGETWFRGSSGKNYIYNGSAWVLPLGGAFSNMSTAGPMNTFAVSGTTLYRFTELGTQIDATEAGNSNCPQGGCQSNAAHTASFSLQFAVGDLGLVSGSSPAVYPTDTAEAFATVRSYATWPLAYGNFDPTTSFTPGGRSGTVHCSILGLIYQTIIRIFSPAPPTDVVILLHESSCSVINGVATLDAKWYNIDPLGRPVCYPKPASSWKEGTKTGNRCTYSLPNLRASVTDDTPTGQGSTVHQEFVGASDLMMVPDCNGSIVSPIWLPVSTSTSRP